jgi:hypothetical protein
MEALVQDKSTGISARGGEIALGIITSNIKIHNMNYNATLMTRVSGLG